MLSWVVFARMDGGVLSPPELSFEIFLKLGREIVVVRRCVHYKTYLLATIQAIGSLACDNFLLCSSLTNISYALSFMIRRTLLGLLEVCIYIWLIPDLNLPRCLSIERFCFLPSLLP